MKDKGVTSVVGTSRSNTNALSSRNLPVDGQWKSSQCVSKAPNASLGEAGQGKSTRQSSSGRHLLPPSEASSKTLQQKLATVPAGRPLSAKSSQPQQISAPAPRKPSSDIPKSNSATSKESSRSSKALADGMKQKGTSQDTPARKEVKDLSSDKSQAQSAKKATKQKSQSEGATDSTTSKSATSATRQAGASRNGLFKVANPKSIAANKLPSLSACPSSGLPSLAATLGVLFPNRMASTAQWSNKELPAIPLLSPPATLLQSPAKCVEWLRYRAGVAGACIVDFSPSSEVRITSHQ